MRLRRTPPALRSVGSGFALFGRGLWATTALLAVLNLAAGAITALAVMATSELAWAQRSAMFADGEITDRGIVSLLLQVGLPAGIAIALVSAIGYLAIAAALGERYAGRKAPRWSFAAALWRGVKRCLPFAAAFAVVVVEVLLAIVLAPLITAAGLVLLAVLGVRGSMGWRTTSSWLSWPMLVAYAVPFGLAVVILVNSLLILPVAAFERHGVRGILRRSSGLVRARAGRVALLGLGGVVFYALVVAGLSGLGAVGVPQPIVAVLMLVAQFTVAAVPVALLVQAYFEAVGGRVPPDLALPRPGFARNPMLGTIATGAAAALVLGFFVPALAPQTAWAEDGSWGDASETQDPPEVLPEAEDQELGDGSGGGGIQPLGEEGGGEEGGEVGSSGGDGANPPPDWWSQGRPGSEGEGRVFGSPSYFDTYLSYENQWGGVIDKPTLGMAVDSLGDEHDAAPGDGWCETSAGTCTLRAAFDELSAWRSGHAGVFMANAQIAEGTVRLTAPLVATTRFSLQGSRDHDWNDLGSRLTIDGQSQHQIFQLTTGSGGGTDLNDLVLRNGYASSGAQGGAVQVLAGSANLNNVLLDGNYAADAGAVNAVYAAGWQADPSARVSVSSSSFANNGVPACHAPGFEVMGPTTIDADDDSCPGTTSTADSLATSVSVYANPQQPKKGGAVTYHATVTKVQSGAEELAGTITFYVAGRDPLTVDVPADGDVSTPAIAAGTADYTLRAVYSGSPGYRGSQSEITVQTDGTASSLVLTAESDTGASWYRGHPLTLIATVASGADGLVPTGEVVFSGGGGHLGTVPIGPDGRAVLETAITSGDGESHGGTLRWGVHAAYAGDAEHAASDAGRELSLASDATILTLTPSQPSAVPGDTVTFTAKVTSNAPGSPPVPHGTVQFFDGLILRDVALNAQGEAALTLNDLTYGTRNISAGYLGSQGRYLSSGGSIAFAVTGAVPSTLNVTRVNGPNPSLIGDAVQWNVNVWPSGVPTDDLPGPTGTVRLMQGDVMLAEGTVPALTVSNLPVGAHDLRIDYLGDGVYQPSSANVQHTVQKMPTSMYFTRSPQTSVIGEPVQINAFVNTSAAGQEMQAVTSGEVRVSYDGSLVGTIDLAQGNSLTAPLPLSLGSGMLVVSYQGTDYYAASGAPVETHTQSKATAAVALEFAQNEVPYAGTVEATVRVTGVAPSTEQPQFGSVQLMRGGVVVAAIPAEQIGGDGIARFSFDAAKLAAGTHSMQARFAGNTWFDDRSSATVTLTVPKHTPRFELAVNGGAGGSSVWGQNVRLDADVYIPWAPNLGLGASDPLGRVDFVLIDGLLETSLGAVNVTEQQRRATLDVPQSLLPPGEHEIIARFTPSPETIDRLDFATTEKVAHSVAAVPVEIDVQGLNAVLPGEAFVRSVLVSEHPDFALVAQPEGTVRVLLDGNPLGDYTLAGLTNNGHPLNIGYANVNFAALAAGPHTITVQYLPAAGSNHASTTSSFDFNAGRVGPTITLDADTRTVDFDSYLFVTAGVEAPFSHYPAPSGKVVVSDGEPGGASCEFTVLPGTTPSSNTCPLFWGEAGDRTVRATFVPDAAEQTYEETTSIQSLPITVRHSAPGFTFAASGAAGSGSQPTAGENVRLQWSVWGTDLRTPEGGVSLAVHPAGAVPAGALAACDTSQRTGSCEVPLTVAGAAAQQVTFTASYAGDTRFSALDRTASLTPRSCVVLDLQATPAGAGTLSPQQTANCGEPGQPKTGYSQNTVVTFDAKPLPSNDLSFDWVLDDPVSVIESTQGRGNGFAVTPTSNWARATFKKSYQCVLVTVDVTNATARELSGEVRLPGGSQASAPNCTYDGTQRSEDRYQAGAGQWSAPSVRSTTHHYSAWYLRGSQPDGIQLRTLTEDAKLYAFEGAAFERDGARIFATAPLMNSTQLEVTFGPTCYPATATATGAGSLTIQNPQNCAEPAAGANRGEGTGAAGWFAGTVLRYQAVPTNRSGDTIGYVKTWAGTDRYAETSPAVYAAATVFDENVGQQIENTTVRANRPAPHATAAFEQCYLVTLERGRLSGGNWVPELPVFTRESNCGHPLASEFIHRSTPYSVTTGSAQASSTRQYFVEGTKIGFEAQVSQLIEGAQVNSYLRFPFYQAPFSGWELNRGADPWPADIALASKPEQQVTVTKPMSFIPGYTAPATCEANVLVFTRDGTRVQVSGTLNNPQEKCGTGNIEQGPSSTLMGSVPGRGQYATHDDIDRAQGSSLTMKAELAEGLNPIVGWVMKARVADPRVTPSTNPQTGQPSYVGRYVSVSQATGGRQITMPLGFDSLSAEAVICQQLDYTVNVTREDGTVMSDFDNGDDLLMAYPAPNCPIAPNAWLVGTEVELWAYGNPVGYKFSGWSGADAQDAGAVLSPSNTALADMLGDELDDFLGAGFPANAVTSFTMDGKSPVKTIDANYQVQCFNATIASPGKSVHDSTQWTSPNCPGFEGKVTYVSNRTGKPYLPAKKVNYSSTLESDRIQQEGSREMTGRYIGGTEIVAIADTDWSNQVWLGWRDDVVDASSKGGKFNPATILVGAGSKPGGDSYAINRYRDRNAGEEFEAIGNDIAVGMKKAVGFVSVVATDYLINYPPVGTVFMVTEGMAMVGSLLEMAGVPKDAVSWMSYPKQITDMLKAPLACIGTWALGSGSAGAVRGVGAVAAEAGKQRTYRVTNITDAATNLAEHQGSMAAGNTGVWASTKLGYYQSKLSLAKLSKAAMPAVSAGLAVYGMVQGSGVKWDDNAEDAWTNFDGYTDCIKKSVPSFLQGSPAAEKAILDYAEQVRQDMLGLDYKFAELTRYTVDSGAVGP